MRVSSHLRWLAGSWLSVALLAAGGCGQAASSPKFETLSGKVAKCHAETGELIVELPAGLHPENDSRLLHCVLTRDSEVYINDRAAAPRDLREGDAVDVIVYRDPNPTLTTFVASYAFVTRPTTAVLPPEFLREAVREGLGPER